MGCATSKEKVEDYAEKGDKSLLSIAEDDSRKAQALARAVSHGSFIFDAETTGDDEKVTSKHSISETETEEVLPVNEHVQDGVTYWVQYVPDGRVFADEESEQDDPDIIGRWDHVAERVVLFTDAVVEQLDQVPEVNKRTPEPNAAQLAAANANTLWVGGIPEPAATEEALREAFARFGALESVTVRLKPAAEHGKKKSWAFVTFVEEPAAKAAQRDEVVVQAEGENVTLKVRETTLEQELSKPTTGALAGIWKTHTSLLEAALESKANIEAASENESVAYGAGTTVHRLEEQLSVDTGNEARRAQTRRSRVGASGSRKEGKLQPMNPGIRSKSYKKLADLQRQISSDREDRLNASCDSGHSAEAAGP